MLHTPLAAFREDEIFPGDHPHYFGHNEGPDWDDPFDPRTWDSNPDVASPLPWTWV